LTTREAFFSDPNIQECKFLFIKGFHNQYCDVLGRMSSLLSNGKLNTSVDKPHSQTVAQDYMATKNRDFNNGTDGISIGTAKCCIEKTRHNRDQISSVPAASCKRHVSNLVPVPDMNQSVPVSGRRQLREREFTRRIQGPTSAGVLSALMIVIRVVVIYSEYKE
jgi:hypothetical protein